MRIAVRGVVFLFSLALLCNHFCAADPLDELTQRVSKKVAYEGGEIIALSAHDNDVIALVEIIDAHPDVLRDYIARNDCLECLYVVGTASQYVGQRAFVRTQTLFLRAWQDGLVSNEGIKRLMLARIRESGRLYVLHRDPDVIRIVDDLERTVRQKLGESSAWTALFRDIRSGRLRRVTCDRSFHGLGGCVAGDYYGGSDADSYDFGDRLVEGVRIGALLPIVAALLALGASAITLFRKKFRASFGLFALGLLLAAWSWIIYERIVSI